MRRIWLGFFIFGVVALAFGQMLSLFFEKVYDFGPGLRGTIAFIFGVGQIIGIVIGGQLGTKMLTRGGDPGVVKLTALGLTGFGLGVDSSRWLRGRRCP